MDILLFSEDQDRYTAHLVDTSQKTVKLISRVLHKMALLPIQKSDKQECLINFDDNLVKGNYNSVVLKALSSRLETYLNQFTTFFRDGFSNFADISKSGLKQLSALIDKIQFMVEVVLLSTHES